MIETSLYSLQELLSVNKIMKSERGKSHSLSAQRYYQQLDLMRNKLYQQLTITTLSPPKHPHEQHHLPNLIQGKLVPKIDRYVSEKIKYQSSLRATLMDIKSKLDISAESHLCLLDSSSAIRKRESRALKAIQQPIWDEFKVKPISLSPVRNKRTHLQQSIDQKNQGNTSCKKEAKKLRKTPVERFNFQPWQTIQQIQF